jgi:glycolate oxidase iron-sulfur subunit
VNPDLLSDCVHCGFCLPTCPTYGVLWQEEMDSPRGRIYLMGSLVDGTIPLSDTTVQHFDRCLGCMACLTSCPSGVKYDRLIEETRAHVEEHYKRSLFDRAQRGMIFATVPHPKRLRRALAMTPPWLPGRLKPFATLKPPWRSSARPPEVTQAVGEGRARVGLLLGCVQRVVFGDVNAATARVLAAEGCEVVAPDGQECCGALHLHAGRADEGRRRAKRLAAAFEDVDAIVVNAAGCGAHLKAYGEVLADDPAWRDRAVAFARRVRDASEAATSVPRRTRSPLRVVYQDACHLAHGQKIRAQPRALLRAVEGVTLVEIADADRCCGSAGIYNLTHPDVAAELQRQKVERILAARPDVIVSANPGCMLQVAAGLETAGSRVPVVHLMRFLDDPAAFA